MSISIEELDATVRSFYEGRGETVSKSTVALLEVNEADKYNSKSKPKQPSTRSVTTAEDCCIVRRC